MHTPHPRATPPCVADVFLTPENQARTPTDPTQNTPENQARTPTDPTQDTPENQARTATDPTQDTPENQARTPTDPTQASSPLIYFTIYLLVHNNENLGTGWYALES